MDALMIEFKTFFKCQFDFDARQKLDWKSIVEIARGILNLQNFDELHLEICQMLKLELFSKEDLEIGFNKHTVHLDPPLLKRRKAILRKYNKVKSKIAGLKRKLSLQA